MYLVAVHLQMVCSAVLKQKFSFGIVLYCVDCLASFGHSDPLGWSEC